MSNLQEQARVLRDQGLSYRDICLKLGIAETSAKRLVNEDYAERSRVQSREAKRRRKGICAECGGETRYNGQGTSRLCQTCGAAAVVARNIARTGSGPNQLRLLEYVTQPRRYIEICQHLGISQNGMGQLLQRLLERGLIRRVSRGVYVRNGDAA